MDYSDWMEKQDPKESHLKCVLHVSVYLSFKNIYVEVKRIRDMFINHKEIKATILTSGKVYFSTRNVT